MSNKNTEEVFARMFALGKIIRARLEKDGLLSLGQLETLRFVASDTPPSMQELARYHHITAPSATAHAGEMVRAGLLERIPDRSDRRAVRLRITQKGKLALRHNMEKRRRIISSLLATLSESDQASFSRILGKILYEQHVY